MIAIVGAGPAGLMAAQTLAQVQRGAQIHVFDAMASVGRKFLLAGRGGLNLTHAEPFEHFIERYGLRSKEMQRLLQGFDAQTLRNWAAALGVSTFVGSSQRVFPVDMKAAPLLRAWLHALRGQGVRFHSRHRWTGWSANGALCFDTPAGRVEVETQATVLALGGASWARLGSDGAWVEPVSACGVEVAPLVPSNCGFELATAWSSFLAQNFAGQPVKPVVLRALGPNGSILFEQQGEFVLTHYGIEGQLVYAASRFLRDCIATNGVATIQCDLLPGRSLQRVVNALSARPSSKSLPSFLKTTMGLNPLKLALLREGLGEWPADAMQLAQRIKACPITLATARPIDEAISTAGGVRFEALDSDLMAHQRPGVFFAGEMLDWEAPTGGYLINGCMATGVAAAQGVHRWLSDRR
jgi:uncharacterized flavoprotein (TIGR03862 family)